MPQALKHSKPQTLGHSAAHRTAAELMACWLFGIGACATPEKTTYTTEQIRCLATRHAAQSEVADCHSKCPDGGRHCPAWRCSTREIESWAKEQGRCVALGIPTYAPLWPPPNTGTEGAVKTGAEDVH